MLTQKPRRKPLCRNSPPTLSCVDSFFLAARDGEGAALKVFCLFQVHFKISSNDRPPSDYCCYSPWSGDCNGVSDDGNEKWMLRLEFIGGR